MISFENTYASLPEVFFQRVQPSSAQEPRLIAFNRNLATELGLDVETCSEQELALIFSGKKILPSSDPIAMVYSGHQFGHFVPRLGDGRAILLGEVVNGLKERFDLQLKGAGQTLYSRGGDGRSPVGPVLREYIVSEALHALGVPTTRTLAAVLTGETVFREEDVPGAMSTRVSRSHIRIGTFEYFVSRGEVDHLRTLADYAIRRHDSDLVEDPTRYLLFFERVAKRQLELVARWMGIGFIHGVMNTDNTLISGDSIDFGPCAFLDAFDFQKVFSSIDHGGRYAYGNQGKVMLWNVSVLARCLAPLVDSNPEKAMEKLEASWEKLPEFFDRKYLEVMSRKFGIFESKPEDLGLVQSFLRDLQGREADFTNSFVRLSDDFDGSGEFYDQWRQRLADQSQTREEVAALMRRSNPRVIPRNHQIEDAIEKGNEGQFDHFHKLLAAVTQPFDKNPEFEKSPTSREEVLQTFCGT